MNMMMKKWKRGLAFVVAVVLTLGLLPASAFAVNDKAKVGDESYGSLL